jgi:hypothetical protein
MLLLMLCQTPPPGRSSPTTSGATTFRRADETEEEGVPLSQAGGMSVAEFHDSFIELSCYVKSILAP